MTTVPASTTPHADAAVTVLRERHERVTAARAAVLEVLELATGHLTADDVTTLVTARAPGVHRATVYRALATLTELGLVTHIHLGGGATVYHLTLLDPVSAQSAAEHVHLQCTVCKEVIDVPSSTMAPLAAQLEHDHGFRLAPDHTALLGVCAHCGAG
ncbi:MAG: Fur family transcriptional regulator [Propionibacteriaceae bacterium]